MNSENVIEEHENFLERLKKYNIDGNLDRWKKGIPHHPESLKIMEEISTLDWMFFNNYFCWKMGGDGDNGETLMYMMDIIFELRDAEKNEKNEKK